MSSVRLSAKIALLVVTALVYVWLYGDTWLDMERVWRSSATYNHCYLIIPIALYFFYRAKGTASAPLKSDHWLWLPALAVFILQFVWLFGYAADINLFMHLAAVMTLQALLWLALGSNNANHHRFAIFYLIFLVPFGEELSPLLQNITADHTVMLLQAVNIPVYRDGLFLATPVGLFEVAEACSGLRFLIASLAISVLFAYLHYNRIWKQVVFVVFMAILSILANGVRAFMLVYIGEKSAMQYGFGADHFVYGWLFFGLVLIAGFWLGARFADPPRPLVRSTREQFYPHPLRMMYLSALMAIMLTLAYKASLNVVNSPDVASNIDLTVSEDNSDSNWGIKFVHSLARTQVQDDNGVEYFAARFANKQQQGELINWQNMLFDKHLWQVQQRIIEPEFGILQLKNLRNEYRTVLYWYQVGEQRSSSALHTKLWQALHYLADDTSMAYVFAVSISDKASAQELSTLRQAAGQLMQQNLSMQNNLTGVADD